jgi:hypothetical protein
MEQEKIHTISSVTMSAMNELEVSDMRPYERLEQFGIEYYQERLSSNQSKGVEVLVATLNPFRQIQLPADFISECVVSLWHNGRAYTIGYNPYLTLLTDIPPCDNVYEEALNNPVGNDQSQIIQGIPIVPFWQGRVFHKNVISAGGGEKHNFYRIDHKKRVIQLNLAMPIGCTILIEYVSSGKDVKGSTLVPPHWVRAMRNEILERYEVRRNPNVSQLYATKKEEAETLAKLHELPPPEAWLDLFYRMSGFKQR